MLCAVSGIFISLPTTTYNKMILYGMWQRSLTLRMLLQSAIATAFNTLNVIYSWLPAKHHFNVNVMCVQYDDNGLSSLKHAQLVRHANSKAATTRTTTAKWKWALDGDFFFCFVSHSTPHTSDTFNSTWHVSASVCAVRVRVSFQSTIKDAFTTAGVCKTFGDCQSVLCEEKEFRPYA